MVTTKAKGFELVGVAYCGKLTWGKLLKDKGCFSKVCFVGSSGALG
jgi:hypothetical protein